VRAVLAVSILVLTFTATALATHPKAGRKYSGFTSEPKLEGFRAPVNFTVSSGATKLTGVQYGSVGCFGAGGFRPGVDPWTGGLITKVGTVSVAANGHFARAGAKLVRKFGGVDPGSLATTTTIAGHFVTGTLATGTISFTQTSRVGHNKAATCGPVRLTFTAKLGR
jgi:hypothetical protein